jgi:acyl carrier protein
MASEEGGAVTPVKTTLRTFILENCLPGWNAADLPDDQSLREERILDSLALMRVISFAEQTFGFQVGVDDLELALGSINELTSLVEQRRTK